MKQQLTITFEIFVPSFSLTDNAFYCNKLNRQDLAEELIFFITTFNTNSQLCHKMKKYNFWLQKKSKSKINIIVEIFGGYLCNNFDVVFRIKSIFKSLMSKVNFSLVFYAKKLKNIKIQFSVTKRGQNQKQI